MASRFSRVTICTVLEIPDDIPPGYVVGRGGQQCKKLEADHDVCCRVDFDERQVSIEGSEDGVNGTIRDLHALFNKFRSRKAQSKKPIVKVQKIGVTVPSGVTDWQFIERNYEYATNDKELKKFSYQLVSIEPFGTANAEQYNEEEAEATPSNGWLNVFNQHFRKQMVQDVANLSTTDLNIKFAFGLLCFRLRNQRVASGEVLSWEHMQRLQLFKDVKPHWSNILNPQSAQLMGLLDELETQFTEETTFATELVVYMTQPQGAHQDISFKFQWESNEWRLVKRKPVRIVHALYDLVLDSTTAVRARVCSREEPHASLNYQEFVDGLVIMMESSEDPFTTTVTMGSDFSSDYIIRSIRVHETATVHWHNLRFKLAYMDPNRQTASLSCLLPKEEDEKLTRTEVMETLMNRVLALMTTTRRF